MATSVKTPPRTLVPDLPARTGGDDARRRRRHRTPPGIGWILPAFVVCAGLIYFCVGYVGYVSLLPWDWRPIFPAQIEGFGSYARAFANPLFWLSLQHTAVFFVATFVIQVVMGIVFAAFLHSRVYFATFFKIAIFVPVVIAPAIMAPVHRRVFAVDGPVNWILQHVGLVDVGPTGIRSWTGWLQSLLTTLGQGDLTPNWIQPATSLWVIIAAQLFSSVGMGFILFFAAMGQVDPEVLEAARIDGAGNLRVLWSIIVPAMRPTIISLAILNAINALKLFDYPYLVTAGGPAHSSEFLGTYIYTELFGSSNHYGYASALSVLLFLLALAISIAMSISAKERRAPRRRTAIARSADV